MWFLLLVFCLLSGTGKETPGALKSVGLGGPTEVKGSSWGHQAGRCNSNPPVCRALLCYLSLALGKMVPEHKPIRAPGPLLGPFTGGLRAEPTYRPHPKRRDEGTSVGVEESMI